MFIDEAWIFVKAGNGGSGCRSFEKMHGKRYGRPTGGDGGGGEGLDLGGEHEVLEVPVSDA